MHQTIYSAVIGIQDKNQNIIIFVTVRNLLHIHYFKSSFPKEFPKSLTALLGIMLILDTNYKILNINCIFLENLVEPVL